MYAQHFDKVKQFVLQNSGSEEDAKDIYQETFLAVWRNIQLDKFQPENETSLDGYIYQVARNKWLDQLRSAKRKKTVSLVEENNKIVEENLLTDESLAYLETVKKQYRQLGEQCKELLHLFYFKRKSMKDIATFFSWTEATAKNNKYRCLEKLREMVINKKK